MMLKVILVMGHTCCGAVKAALTGNCEGLLMMVRWLVVLWQDS